MRIRTASIGLPKTYARCKARLRRDVPLGERLPVDWLPLTKPVSVLGAFVLGLLTHEHEKRNPTADAMVGVDRSVHNPIDRAEHERRVAIHVAREREKMGAHVTR